MYFVINKKTAFLLLIALTVLLSAFVGGVTSVFNGTVKKIPIYSVERPDNKVALTFNCAWDNHDIDEILAILSKHNVKATFFIVGTWAEKYPEDVLKIKSHGHEIGSHSYNHGHYNKMSYDEILDDIEKCENVIEEIIGSDIYLVRGGYGEYNNDVIDACLTTNRTYIQWSVDSLDYKAKSKEEILKRVLDKTEAGDIILMHTGTEFTKDSLDELLENLKQNFELSTVSDFIYKENFTIDHSGKQKEL